MTTINWVHVLKLKEFQSYFNTHELQQLSMVSNMFRTCLKSAIFKTFNFRQFIFYREYHSYFSQEEDLDNSVLTSQSINPYKPLTIDFELSKNMFKQHLKEFLSSPSKLVLSNCHDYSYLLYNVSELFSNLTNINICHSQLQFELFQHLLDSLNCLESVEIFNTKFLQYTQNSIQVPFNWPKTLKYLKLGYNELGFAFNKETSIRVSVHGSYNIPTSDLKLSAQKLHDLISFEYSMLGNLANNDDIFSFLKLNQQIKLLKINIDGFDRSLFNSIKLLVKLSHLGLNVVEFGSQETQNVRLPVLNTVSHLYTSSHYISENRDSISNMFPNLDNLSVKFDEYSEGEALLLIQIFPEIRSLSFDIYYTHIKPNELTIPRSSNLVRLEFNLFCSIDFSISIAQWNTEACPNLKLIKFKKFNNDVPFEEPKLSPWMINDWKTVYYPHAVTFYRIIKNKV